MPRVPEKVCPPFRTVLACQSMRTNARRFHFRRGSGRLVLLLLLAIPLHPGCLCSGEYEPTPRILPTPETSLDARAEIRCLLALEMAAAQSNYHRGSLFELDLSGFPPAAQEACRWTTRTGDFAREYPCIDVLHDISLPENASTAQAMLTDKRVWRRLQALRWLRAHRETVDPARLKSLLADADPDVQMQAAMLAAEAETPGLEDDLAALAASPTGEARLVAAEALGFCGSAAGLPVLQRLLTDADSHVRYKAAWALGRLNDSAAVDSLIGAMDDSDIDIVRQAAYSLMLLGDPRCLSKYWERLSLPDEFVRRTIAHGLEKFIHAGFQSEVRQTFHGLPAERQVILRAALTGIGAGLILETVGPPAAGSREPECNTCPQQAGASKLQALDWRHPEQILPLLLRTDAEVAKEAATTLGLLGGAEAVETLLRAYPQADPDTRAMILSALAFIGDARALPLLRKELKTADSDQLRRVILAIGMTGDVTDGQALLSFLDHPDAVIRAQAARALGLLGDAEAIFALQKKFTDPATRVRNWAAWSVASLAGENTCAYLADRPAGNDELLAWTASLPLYGKTCAVWHEQPMMQHICWWTVLRELTDLEADLLLRKMWLRGRMEQDEGFLVTP